MNHEERERQSDQHAREPKVGDYWHDHFSPVLCVVDVGEFHVSYLENVVHPDPDHWTWDVTKVDTTTRKAFNERLRYRGLPGNSASHPIGDKTWADVVPERDVVFAEAAKEAARV